MEINYLQTSSGLAPVLVNTDATINATRQFLYRSKSEKNSALKLIAFSEASFLFLRKKQSAKAK